MRRFLHYFHIVHIRSSQTNKLCPFETKVWCWPLVLTKVSLCTAHNTHTALQSHSALHTTHTPLYDMLPHHQIYRIIQNDCRGTIVQRQFRTNFGKQPPSDNSIRRWYAQFQETGCVCIPELKVRIRTAI